MRQFIAEKGVGRDLFQRSMHAPWPQLRRELATRLITAGFSISEAARIIGLHHSAVIMMVSPRRQEKLARMREYTRRRKAAA